MQIEELWPMIIILLIGMWVFISIMMWWWGYWFGIKETCQIFKLGKCKEKGADKDGE